ncbi:MAG: SRPBCC domain-containing protein [Bacteroidales bacterium]|jgi:uncharacterized protein YndB with AHSA1/START domain|nr:SRPBCC domain-containing protein [Bacteroidales bacterium]
MKRRFELEYTLNVSPSFLFSRLSTPGGLSEWFADDVNLKGKVFTFLWKGSQQSAEILAQKENRYIRFRWLEKGCENCYFEFRIRQDQLTGDVALIVTDYAEEQEKDDVIELWNMQIARLKHVIGL